MTFKVPIVPWLLTLLISGMAACRPQSPGTQPERISITWPDTLGIPPWTVVVQPAGELPYYHLNDSGDNLLLDSTLAAQWDFLPCPANLGILQPLDGVHPGITTLILATRVPAGTRLQMHLLALCQLNTSDGIKTYLVGYPHNPKLRIIRAGNYQDFSTAYDQTRTLIQNYLVQREGLGKVERVRWQNEQFALNYLSDMYLVK